MIDYFFGVGCGLLVGVRGAPRCSPYFLGLGFGTWGGLGVFGICFAII